MAVAVVLVLVLIEVTVVVDENWWLIVIARPSHTLARVSAMALPWTEEGRDDTCAASATVACY